MNERSNALSNPNLWSRLHAFEFDDIGASAPFSTKLGVAENWSDEFTWAVITEYRRYLYLTQVSETPLVPPLAILRAWQMHLTFSRNYWNELCAKVFDQPLHYDPIQNESDLLGYRIRYEDARRLYTEEFGEAPPDSIWRAKPDDHPLDTPPFPGGRYFAIWGFGVLVSFPLALFDLIPWIVPVGGLITLVVAVIAVAIWIEPKHRRKPSKDEGELWFEFEYRNTDSDGGDGGDGDGGGCGD